MATLWITEMRALPRGRAGDQLPVAQMPPEKTQKITFSSATQSAAFSASTRFVRLYSDADCCIHFGENPTATSSSMPMASDAPEYFGVEPGTKLSVIAQ